MMNKWIRLLAYITSFALLCESTAAAQSDMPLPDEPKNLIVTGVVDNTIHKAFVHDHPEMNIVLKEEYLRSSGRLIQSLLSRDDSFDVMVLFTENHDVGTLIQKGYCKPLNESGVIMQVVEQMYPAFSSCVTKEGIVYGLPLEAFMDTLAYDEEAFAALGIEPPSSWADIISLINNWPAQPDDVLEQYQVASTTDYRRWTLRGIISSYVYHTQCQDLPLTFKTDEFEHLMTLQSEVTTANDLDENDFSIDELTPLIYSGIDILSMDWQRYKPLVIDWEDNLEDSIRCRLFIAFINPGTHHSDEALTYITYLADHMSERNQILLMEGKHDPVEALGFSRWMENWKEQEEILKANLINATPSERSEAQRIWDDHQKSYDDLMRIRYDISTEDIAAYAAIVDHIWVSPPSLLDDQGDGAETYIDNVLDRYLDGYYTDIKILIEKMEEKIKAIIGERGEV